MRSTLLFVALALFGCALAGDLMDEIMTKGKECIKEGNVIVDDCKEMLEKENLNEDDPKYKPCKCAAACTLKKFEAMSPDGKLNREKFKELKEKIDDKEMKKEAERVFKPCFEKVEDKTDCDAGYELAKCGVQSSDMVKEMCLAMMEKAKEK